MKKLLTSAAIAAAIASGIALAAPANATEGGSSQAGEPHSWIKVPLRDTSSNPATQYGMMGACRPVNPIVACNHLVPLLAAQKAGAPGANGFWAEWYPKSGITRSGTW